MKKFIAGAIVGFLAAWGYAFASPTFNHNGTFWNRLSGDAKSGYVDGYNDAMQVSVDKLDSLTIAADLFHWKGAHKIIHQLTRELSLSDVTTAEAVQRLNSLYASSKYSELDLGSALQLLSVPASDRSTRAGTKPRPADR
ncbi:MAG TPA: hypothetical protein VMD75_16270 [Candidatus Binataceae bacterium]|nr:hypothetical protein [Candidatus Binataceae bacterium]